MSHKSKFDFNRTLLQTSAYIEFSINQIYVGNSSMLSLNDELFCHNNAVSRLKLGTRIYKIPHPLMRISQIILAYRRI